MTQDNDDTVVRDENTSQEAAPLATTDTTVKNTGPVVETASLLQVADVQATSYLSLIFRDGLDMPIDGLTFIATFPSGQMCTAESTDNGAIALPIPAKAQGEVKLEVKDAAGNKQAVCTLDLDKCDGTVIVRSPKTKAKLSLQPHQQIAPVRTAAQAAPKQAQPAKAQQPDTEPKPADTQSSWWGANGAWHKAWNWITSEHHFFSATQTAAPSKPQATPGLTNAGQPITPVLGPEAPTKDNLRLGRNNIYREPILEASKRLGLIPQALCALMDCEAGKVSEKLPMLNADGTPITDKKGKPRFQIVRERWNANAGNAESGAAGLTQFLASTWLTHVLIPGYYIHQKSVVNGWVKQEATAKGKKYWTFVLADGSTTTTPYKKRGSDANVKKCLAMRMDPDWSINAAADYGNANLKVLENAGFKFSGLNDMGKAKLMYLMHHEGEGAGPLFIRNTLGSAKGGITALKKKFILQLGASGATKVEELITEADDDVEVAYRFWFSTFVDKQFSQTSKYFFSSPVTASKLSAILVSLGGKEIEIVE